MLKHLRIAVTALIDVCAADELDCKHFAAESGLSLGALGPLAAQQLIGFKPLKSETHL
jgi:hypothetical protein